MKKSTITTALLSVSLALPATLLAQMNPTPPTAPTTSLSQDKDKEKQDKHGERKTTMKDGKYGHGLKSASIRAVHNDELDGRLTAESIIGKDVVDVRGEKIGSVKDISFGSSMSDVVAKEFGARTESKTGLATTPGMGATRTTAASGTTAGSPSDRPLMGSMDRERSGSLTDRSGSNSDEIEVYVTVGGVMGVGSSLVSIPYSQLSYDAEKENFRLDVSQEEVRAIADNANKLSSRD